MTDSKNSSWRVIDIDQASLGMSREYLINGFEDDDVTSYFNYMVSVAVLLGADRATAEKELKESLMFEIELAHASQAREQRASSTRIALANAVADVACAAAVAVAVAPVLGWELTWDSVKPSWCTKLIIWKE